MAHKQLLFRAEAREKVLRGASALADAVRVTLGPKSKSVLLLTEATLTEVPEEKSKTTPGLEGGME